MDLPDSPKQIDSKKPVKFGYQKDTEDIIAEIKAKQELDQKRHKEQLLRDHKEQLQKEEDKKQREEKLKLLKSKQKQTQNPSIYFDDKMIEEKYEQKQRELEQEFDQIDAQDEKEPEQLDSQEVGEEEQEFEGDDEINPTMRNCMNGFKYELDEEENNSQEDVPDF